MRVPRWKIVDTRTNKRVTIASYPSVKSAKADIDFWQVRHDKGKRPDITQELLDHLEVRPEDD